MANLPSFLCVGAGKSGTTALYNYLRQHPQVFLPAQKELQFFAWPDLKQFNNGPGTARSRDDWIKSEADYRALYANAPNDVLAGDISPTYLHAPGAPDRMAAMLGDDLRIIIMLRNPVDKVISQYGHLRRDVREDLLLEDALDAEKTRIDAGWGAIYHYVATSRYSEAVQRYLDRFGPDRVHIVFFEDFVADPVAHVRAVCRFLNIADDIAFSNDVKTNRSGLPKSKALAKVIGPNWFTSLAKMAMPRQVGVRIKTVLMNANTGSKEQVTAATRARLRDIFRDDVVALEKLTNRTTGWVTPVESVGEGTP